MMEQGQCIPLNMGHEDLSFCEEAMAKFSLATQHDAV